jgi:hypothetical protein
MPVNIMMRLAGSGTVAALISVAVTVNLVAVSRPGVDPDDPRRTAAASDPLEADYMGRCRDDDIPGEIRRQRGAGAVSGRDRQAIDPGVFRGGSPGERRRAIAAIHEGDACRPAPGPLSAAAGNPAVASLNDPAAPTANGAVAALVVDGASLTVKVKPWLYRCPVQTSVMGDTEAAPPKAGR